MIDRRKFMQSGAAACAGLMLGNKVLRGEARGPLARYVDQLPIPPVLNPSAGINTVVMTEFFQQLHRDLPSTRLWGYNGSYPGPTIEARRGRPLDVRWTSNLPDTHFLPVDPTIHGADMGVPIVRNVVHLHGIKGMPESDGYPEAWFTPGHRQVGPSFDTEVYRYPNDQRATTLWYHDHALGITRLNVYAGLAGFYIIRDGHEKDLNLPRGKYEIPLMIQDRMFNPDGSLLYPVAVGGSHQCWIPEFFGDTILVNGKVWPYLEVEPRRYRFRMLNASNARFLNLTLKASSADGTPTGAPGPVMVQIGTDGGLLPRPVPLSELLLAKAERADLIIDFSGHAGRYFVFQNDAPAPYPDGGETVPSDVMQFRVVSPLSSPDTSSLPASLNEIELYEPDHAARVRTLELSELDRASDGFPIVAQLGGLHWDDPVTEDPVANSIEIWQLVNTTGDAHPIHVHLVQFQVLDRRPFDVDQFQSAGRLVFTGPPVPPAPNERPAWKDTVTTLPGTVTRIIQRFILPDGAQVTSGQRLRYVWHCHILEHEDNEMMRPFEVVVP